MRDKLITKARTLLASCEGLEGKELETAQAEYQTAVAAVKQHDELEKLAVLEGKTPKPTEEPTPRIEVVGQERELERHFMSALHGKSVPERAMDEFQCTNPGFKKGGDGLKAPPALARQFRTAAVNAQLEGKVDTLIPILSTDDPGPANTFQTPILPVEHVEAEPTRLIDMVRTIPAPQGGLKFPRIVQTDSNEYGAIEITWGSEGEEKEETELQINQIEVSTFECRAYTEVSDVALRRSPVFEPWLTRMFREAGADSIEDAIAGGNGTTQPEGLSVAAMREVLRTTASSIEYADLIALKYLLRNNHRLRSVFVVQDTGLKDLETDMDTAGRPIFAASTANGIYDRLVGRPYVGSHRMAALGAEGDIVLLDPSAYVLAVETDIMVRRSTEYKFRNNLTAFSVFSMVGGRLVHPRLAARLEDTGASSTSDD